MYEQIQIVYQNLGYIEDGWKLSDYTFEDLADLGALIEDSIDALNEIMRLVDEASSKRPESEIVAYMDTTDKIMRDPSI